MYKKARCTCKFVVLLNKPVAFLTFSLPSPSSLPKLLSVPIMRTRERHQDNRTVVLTGQDFLPDRTVDGDLLSTFSSNILDFRRSLSPYFNFGSRHEDSSRFYRQQDRLWTRKSRSARFKNSFSNVKLVSEVSCFKSSNICLL